MQTRELAKEIVLEALLSVLNGKEVEVEELSALSGPDSIIDSLSLVELCVELEDKANSMGFEFDWISESVMQKTSSMFTSVSSLIDEFFTQALKGNDDFS